MSISSDGKRVVDSFLFWLTETVSDCCRYIYLVIKPNTKANFIEYSGFENLDGAKGVSSNRNRCSVVSAYSLLGNTNFRLKIGHIYLISYSI